MWRLFLFVVPYAWSVMVQHTAVICHHKFVPWTLTAVFHWLNILMKEFTLLVADFTKAFWKQIYMWMQKINCTWYATSHFLIRSIQKSLVTITEIKRFLCTSEVCTDPRKLSQAACSVSATLSTKASPFRSSRICGPTKMPSFSFAVLILGNVLLRYWNPLEFVLVMAFTKH